MNRLDKLPLLLLLVLVLTSCYIGIYPPGPVNPGFSGEIVHERLAPGEYVALSSFDSQILYKLILQKGGDLRLDVYDKHAFESGQYPIVSYYGHCNLVQAVLISNDASSRYKERVFLLSFEFSESLDNPFNGYAYAYLVDNYEMNYRNGDYYYFFKTGYDSYGERISTGAKLKSLEGYKRSRLSDTTRWKLVRKY